MSAGGVPSLGVGRGRGAGYGAESLQGGQGAAPAGAVAERGVCEVMRAIVAEGGRLLTVPEAAAETAVSASTIRTWIERGHLRVLRSRGIGFVVLREVFECERDRRRSGRRRRGATGGAR